jgi:membrane protein implicated in regulation of membrane protease activity
VSAWVVWLIAAALLAGAESLSGDFVLAMCGGAALGGAATAALGGPVELQFAVAIVLAVGLVAFVRPVVKRQLAPARHLTGAGALVGREGVALTTVDGDGGRVRLNGQEWSARSAGSAVLPPGTRVRVLRIDGATAVVLDESPPAIPS